MPTGQKSTSERFREWWLKRDRHIHIIINVLALGVTIASGFQLIILFRQPASASAQDRVQQLSKSLSEATQLIDQMQIDIESRQRMVTKLQGDLETYDKLAALKKDEVEAVAQVLRGEIDKSSRRSFWEGVAVNFAFFILGAIASWFIGRRQNRRGNAILLEDQT
jgi:hypothetical protein